ncbi:MAG: thioredoxin family protein [Candidatus Melainabacteria bacterium]|nr:thioredoxin family protein [Candidatus Melainabacteria bacterium]
MSNEPFPNPDALPEDPAASTQASPEEGTTASIAVPTNRPLPGGGAVTGAAGDDRSQANETTAIRAAKEPAPWWNTAGVLLMCVLALAIFWAIIQTFLPALEMLSPEYQAAKAKQMATEAKAGADFQFNHQAAERFVGLTEVSKETIQSLFKDSYGNPILVVFSSPMCHDCQKMAPTLARLKQTFRRVRFKQYETTQQRENADVFRAFQPASTPILVYISPFGKILDVYYGFQPDQKLEASLKALDATFDNPLSTLPAKEQARIRGEIPPVFPKEMLAEETSEEGGAVNDAVSGMRLPANATAQIAPQGASGR